MGLGDEIMALGRCEALFEKTGIPVSITNELGNVRNHVIWHGNPAWSEKAAQRLVDGAGHRPYIKRWSGDTIEFNLAHKPRAGRIWLTNDEFQFAYEAVKGDFAVIAPYVKDTASPNKEWDEAKWEEVIANVKAPVYQLLPVLGGRVIKGAKGIYTSTARKAAAIIARAGIVLCNEGGTHHMAASMRVPAVVIFGAFIPPSVTGYDFHRNVGIETPEGYCGKWGKCSHCEEAMKRVTVDMVLQEVRHLGYA